VKAEDSLFLADLKPGFYISYYLPLRVLISSVTTVAQYQPEKIPAALTSFRGIDYTDPRMQKSGLLADAIESHFWLIENSGRSMDSVYIEMHRSIDILVENLLPDEQKLNKITEHLFKFLEKRSLFGASEYLALKLLNERSCIINEDFAAQLESYRMMRKGNIASEIVFLGDIFAPGYTSENTPKNLSDIQSLYKAIVFGAGWCPRCATELQSIAQNYTKWKQQGVEVIFVSLDEDKQIFTNFIKPFPFISTCDYKKWDSPTVKDYHVFATLTIYLLNSKHEILLKPNSVHQLNSWVDWFLVKAKQ
jgi:thiol-disulfide isomerase/thioredoxin